MPDMDDFAAMGLDEEFWVSSRNQRRVHHVALGYAGAYMIFSESSVLWNFHGCYTGLEELLRQLVAENSGRVVKGVRAPVAWESGNHGILTVLTVSRA